MNDMLKSCISRGKIGQNCLSSLVHGVFQVYVCCMEAVDKDVVYMRRAIEQALRAYEEEEVPIGAVVVCNGKIIGKGYNQTEKLSDITAHAEMIALTAASGNLGGKYLEECTLYVTIEPCVMCAGAIQNARLGRIVYGASEPKTGFRRFLPDDFYKRTEIVSGCLEQECRELMQNFFRSKRN